MTEKCHPTTVYSGTFPKKLFAGLALLRSCVCTTQISLQGQILPNTRLFHKSSSHMVYDWHVKVWAASSSEHKMPWSPHTICMWKIHQKNPPDLSTFAYKYAWILLEEGSLWQEQPSLEGITAMQPPNGKDMTKASQMECRPTDRPTRKLLGEKQNQIKPTKQTKTNFP